MYVIIAPIQVREGSREQVLEALGAQRPLRRRDRAGLPTL